MPENPLQLPQELWLSVLLAESEHYLKKEEKKEKGKQNFDSVLLMGEKNKTTNTEDSPALLPETQISCRKLYYFIDVNVTALPLHAFVLSVVELQTCL